MDQLPIWLGLKGRPVKVAGTGTAASAKARLAVQAGAAVTLFSPVLEEDAAELVSSGAVRFEARNFCPDDADDAALMFSATGSESEDRIVAEAAKAAGVPVNVVDRPTLSTFLMPAIVDRGPVVVGISTGGASPALAVRVRAKIEAVLPHRLEALARFAGSFRDAVRARVPAPAERIRFWNRVLGGAVARAVLAGRDGEARAGMLRLLNASSADAFTKGVVYLVGSGPGDPELVTLRALRLIQEADVLVYDRLVDDAVLDYARRDAERIYVGKQASRHSIPQERIHEILVERAERGLRVVRLKGGDPFVFGRGGEEADALAASGVTVEVVPGVSAALGCAAAAGVPLTHRDHAGAVTFVTGHSRSGGEEPDWGVLARLRHTLVVYMGIANAASIAAKLMAEGLSGSTPVTVIENGTLPQERVLSGRLDGLAELIEFQEIKAPALLMIGDVASRSAAAEVKSIMWSEVG